METLVKEGALGSVLVRSRIISEEDIRAALDEQRKTGCRFGEALVKLGIVTQEDIDWALSNQLNIPYVRLKPEMIDKEAARLVPGSLARKYNLIPIFRAGDEIGIALADPLNKAAIKAVEQLTGCRVSVSIPIMRELREMLDIFYGAPDTGIVFGFSSQFFPEMILDGVNGDISGGRFLDLMLLYIIKNKLTSISLQPLGDFVSVIGRQGQLTREIGRLTIDYYPDLLMYIRKHGKIKACTDISAGGTFEFRHKGETVFFRVLTLRGQGGDYVTFKIHVPVFFPVSYGELGATGEVMSAFRSMLSAGRGMVMFNAATTEECSRVMDLFLNEYDTTGKTVIMLGEGLGKANLRYPCIFFRKGPKQEMESVVAAVLEHDPDILVFEDVNDDTTFVTAALAAIRGKIVLCGTSCLDVTDVPRRLMELRHNSSMLQQIRGYITFRAGMVNCADCIQDATDGADTDPAENFPNLPDWRLARGCPACGYSGFSGRKFMVEAIPFTDEIVKVISSASDADEALEYLAGKGCSGKWKEWNELLRTGGIIPAEYVLPAENRSGKCD
jgi:type IV pilus assembly protein PilB